MNIPISGKIEAQSRGGQPSIFPGYMSGFGNGFETEALPGALPVGRNSPQRCPYGLFAEQLSGSPFTAPRQTNERTWLYRIRPSIANWGEFKALGIDHWLSAPSPEVTIPISPVRWSPVPIPERPLNFIHGVHTMTTAGDVSAQSGMAAHLYFVNRAMVDEYLYNADGEMLILPQEGGLKLCTEFGIIDITPGEVAIIPRGVKMRVELLSGPSRGYICENYGGAFTLPERGPIGANCLANPRDFMVPQAAFEDRDVASKLYVKWGGRFWVADIEHSPLDVVAWHGNYAPYKYDLRRYSPVGPILFDHADPSIYTVLTSPSETRGTANVDFVIFPDRWMVAENTFRPPWYHMNVMSEFMGLIYGMYDAKATGFVPGGSSLHNCMLPHGPDGESFLRGSNTELKPHKLEGTLAFMFESRISQRVTPYAAGLKELQKDYASYGKSIPKTFDPTKP